MSGCTEEEPEEFGFTCIELRRGEAVDNDPFAGTRTVEITLNYEPCLREYYLNKRPEMRADGVEGEVVFAEWKDRLCTEEISGRATCEVEAFEQILTEVDMSYRMRLTYTVENLVAGQKLLWGPGPLPDFAECAMGLKPFVNLSTLTGVVGKDAAGKTIWDVQSFGSMRGIMQLTGGGCIGANIAPRS